MGRSKGPDVKQILIRMPESLYGEIIILHPSMEDPRGGLRYGAVSEYFNRLAREDCERITRAIRQEAIKNGR